jgi:hypothetical protein
MLDVIRNGITSMSIDFGLMGEMAAQFIVAKVPVRAYLPTLLINRNSV